MTERTEHPRDDTRPARAVGESSSEGDDDGLELRRAVKEIASLKQKLSVLEEENVSLHQKVALLEKELDWLHSSEWQRQVVQEACQAEYKNLRKHSSDLVSNPVKRSLESCACPERG